MITEKLLKKIKEMRSMSIDNIDLLLSCAEQIELKKGQRLLNEGQICNHLYFVEKGFIRTYIIQDGKEININFTFESNFNANIKSLKTNQPSKHIIEAGEKTLVTLFEKNTILELYNRSLEIELLCRKILGLLVIESNDFIDFYKLHTPTERYQYLMKHSPLIIQRISISQLSSYIGVARETLSRIRKCAL
jgi:CRP-like cAMP-binding protein